MFDIGNCLKILVSVENIANLSMIFTHSFVWFFNIKLQVSIAVALEEVLFYVVIYNHDIKNRLEICQTIKYNEENNL